jgi:hypothetical protein
MSPIRFEDSSRERIALERSNQSGSGEWVLSMKALEPGKKEIEPLSGHRSPEP